MENSEQIAARSVRRLSASTFSPARFICLAVGGMAVVSAGLINPPMVGLFRDNYLDYRDVSLEYMAIALGPGSVLILAGMFAPRAERMASGLLLLVSLVAITLTDRALLVYWGRSPWITDTVLHYRHRPGVQHTFEYIDWDVEEILQRNGAVAPEAGVVEALRGLQA